MYMITLSKYKSSCRGLNMNKQLNQYLLIIGIVLISTSFHQQNTVKFLVSLLLGVAAITIWHRDLSSKFY